VRFFLFIESFLSFSEKKLGKKSKKILGAAAKFSRKNSKQKFFQGKNQRKKLESRNFSKKI